jgi:hypothetical protein
MRARRLIWSGLKAVCYNDDRPAVVLTQLCQIKPPSIRIATPKSIRAEWQLCRARVRFTNERQNRRNDRSQCPKPSERFVLGGLASGLTLREVASE